MRRRILVRSSLAVGLGLGLAWAVAHRHLFTDEIVRGQLEALGGWAPLAFVGAYAIATPLFLPGSVLTLVAGALLGPIAGTAWSLIGATLGASLSFGLARTLVGDVVARRAGPRLDVLLRRIEGGGWRSVALVRLVPLFPFSLSNYAFGLTRIGFVPYALTSLVCMLPGTATLAWAGHSGRAALGGEGGAGGWGLAALGGLALTALLPRLIRGPPPDDGARGRRPASGSG
ncbi:MAG TPA: TVP38/TMEM64 family protein [Deltaproteobacteria bacterium]|nr:TVP38/TMEM64 family protein [Deltaproteobacteria bacterium]